MHNAINLFLLVLLEKQEKLNALHTIVREKKNMLLATYETLRATFFSFFFFFFSSLFLPEKQRLVRRRSRIMSKLHC